ncbi:MAG: AglZ/HisF2 family acetamidino modification protein [bacterium]
MLKNRVIPCLLLQNQGLVKTIRFKEPKYVGDPINAIRIFNEKEVDELIFLDIIASKVGRSPNFEILQNIVGECFMPLCYGGGISRLEDIQKIFSLGVEKISINSFALKNIDFIKQASEIFGSQSIVVTIDVKKNFLEKYKVYDHTRNKITDIDPVEFAITTQEMGAGEILLNSVDRDGTQGGYDIDLITKITNVLSIPVIAMGGAGKIDDFVDAVKKGNASAVAAGSMFVFHGKHRAVLITYPEYQELEKRLV